MARQSKKDGRGARKIMGGLLGSAQINRVKKKIDDLKSKLEVKEQDDVFCTARERELLELCVELLDIIEILRYEILRS